MNWALENSGLIQVLCLGVGGSTLALCGLWLERRANPRHGRILAGGTALVLAVLATILWIATRALPLVWPVLALAAAAVLASAVESQRLRRSLSWLLRPRAVWGLLLAVGPVFSLLFAWQLNQPDELLEYMELSPVAFVPETGICAFTDCGRPVRLFHYEELASLEDVESSTLEDQRMKNRVIRLSGPASQSNCHGWVFAGGNWGVSGTEVDDILTDNGYSAVTEAAPGDIVVYRDHQGAIRHTGLVRLVGSDGVVLIESKWGPMGLYLHPPESQPWGRDYDFYRSSRHGHELSFAVP